MLSGLLTMVDYFTTRVKLHGQWGPRLEISVCRGWTGLPECCSWLLGIEVASVRDGSWSCRCFTSLYLAGKPSHVEADVHGLACFLHHPNSLRMSDGVCVGRGGTELLDKCCPSRHAVVGTSFGGGQSH
jgi:hypothetical protein